MKYDEPWQESLVEGFLNVMTDEEVLCGHKALTEDRESLIHGATTSPPPIGKHAQSPVSCACFISYCLWKARGLKTVADVEEAFATACVEAGVLTPKCIGARGFLNFWDEEPPEVAKSRTLEVVEKELERRGMSPIK